LTAVLDQASGKANGPVNEDVAAGSLAPWSSRAAAFAVDVLIPLGVIAAILLVWFAASMGTWLWWAMTIAGAIVVLLVASNRWILPAIAGWSVGRALLGLRVVRAVGNEPVGMARLAARDAAHLLDTAALFVGWLWPLWDARNRTFADLLLRTEVHLVDNRPQRARRVTAGVVIGAVVLSAAAVGLGYLAVYRNDQTVDAARDEISKQGPKIVADMLSYNASSLQADFDRAQSLTTDSYRPTLIAQQDAVRKAVPTTNEYWAANSAVLSVSPDRASMLLMLQGQRTASQQQQRFISATVRVNFEKSPQGKWRVADMTVLTKPYANGPAK
jgi:Mce-associated membrane protein